MQLPSVGNLQEVVAATAEEWFDLDVLRSQSFCVMELVAYVFLRFKDLALLRWIQELRAVWSLFACILIEVLVDELLGQLGTDCENEDEHEYVEAPGSHRLILSVVKLRVAFSQLLLQFALWLFLRGLESIVSSRHEQSSSWSSKHVEARWISQHFYYYN